MAGTFIHRTLIQPITFVKQNSFLFKLRNCSKNVLYKEIACTSSKRLYSEFSLLCRLYGTSENYIRNFSTYTRHWVTTLSFNNFKMNSKGSHLRLLSTNNFYHGPFSTSLIHSSPIQGDKGLPLLACFSRPTAAALRCKHTMPRVPPTRMNGVYEIEGAITDREAAKQFVYALNINERKHLYEELANFHGESVTLTDPAQEKPTRQQLKQVALHQMFPFIGFGFLDNFLMIVAGEYIDVTLGVTFGISTMAAAALGNLISDIAGLGSAHYVEILAAKVGMKNPHLSPAQVDMGSTKFASNMGKIIGVTIGCLLGMFPLLFFKDDKEDNKATSEKKDSPETEK
ncbi:transmembrane protein 65-like isoform X3 [Biomphalaria glabrata]|nr:transmembrane protein 65-like isoform X3 [Biomphalaria glabrata]